MAPSRDYIFSEDRKSILKMSDHGKYEVAATFEEPFPMEEEQNTNEYFPAEEKEISSIDPSFLDIDSENREKSEANSKEKAAIKPFQKPEPPKRVESLKSRLEQETFPLKSPILKRHEEEVSFSPSLCSTPQPIAFSTPYQSAPLQQPAMRFLHNKVPPGYLLSTVKSLTGSYVYPHPVFLSQIHVIPTLNALKPPRFIKKRKELEIMSPPVGGELVEDPPRPPPRKTSILKSESERGILPKMLRAVPYTTLYDVVRSRANNNVL